MVTAGEKLSGSSRDGRRSMDPAWPLDRAQVSRSPAAAMRPPNAAWVDLSRLRALSARQKERFLPLCPDFVLEVASPSDEISALTLKMEEYRQAGLRRGWLILPHSIEVEVFSPAGVQVLTSPESLSGDPVIPGFRMEVESIWNPPF